MPATGLYHVGARAYDPRTARWLQRDPIDVASVDPNLYRYCGNDPLNAVDPTGLDALDNAAHFFAGWGDRLTGGLTKNIRDWLCDALDLPRWEPRDPCDEWYLAGHLTGAVHDRLLTRGAGGGGALRFARSKTSGNNLYAQKGRQIHNQFKQKVEQKAQQQQARNPNKPTWQPEPTIVDPQSGKKYRPDAISPSGHPVELKPNTPSGRRRGEQQLKKYEEILQKRGRLILY